MSTENRVIFNCDWCGKEAEQRASKYNDRKHHFCGRSCFNAWMKRDRIEVQCVVCGKSKTVTQCEIKGNKTGIWFCSNKCRSKWHDQKSEINVTKLVCENCNCEFIIRNCVLTSSNGKRRFCTKKCEKDWYKKKRGNKKERQIKVKQRFAVNCSNCGKEKEVTKYNYKNKKNHFCNRKCFGEWKSKNTKGKNHPRWSKVEVECDFCGKTKLMPKCLAEREQKNHFCNQKCQMAWRKENQSGEKWATYKRNIVKCENCGKEKLVKDCELKCSLNNRFFCNKKCQLEWRIKTGFASKENNVNWKGGENEIWYDDYIVKLCSFEETRKDPNNNKLIQVSCTYCGSFFNPTRKNVLARIAWFEGRNDFENRFYCSDNCKNNCPIYGQSLYPKGYRIDTSREVQPELRKMCFERDNWTCQICESKEDLHCHHYEGIQYNPIESADLDMVVTLCSRCHNNVHSEVGCRRVDLRCK